MGRFGLFGGTFDPIHLGHTALAKRVLEDFSLDKIIFIPAGTPPHKQKQQITEAHHRYRMAELATAAESGFCVSDYEVSLKTPCYSYLTVTHFKALYPKDELFFLIGGDSFYNLPEWKNYRTLLTLCTFLVVPRPGVEKKQYLDKFRGDETPPRVHFVKDFSYDISSTEVRRRIQSGECIKNCVEKSVEDYIRKNRLYL